ncbi:MAG: V-type ATP synthase subunit B, partial [Oscillospiraceae bacterium]|nr:V-type ATP synthase subunit B [Oscillospiraceae bacterium]
MAKEYRTIDEVAGPLMLVRDVESASYNELGEIILGSGERRLCKVLEMNGKDALVQLFESGAGINLE